LSLDLLILKFNVIIMKHTRWTSSQSLSHRSLDACVRDIYIYIYTHTHTYIRLLVWYWQNFCVTSETFGKVLLSLWYWIAVLWIIKFRILNIACLERSRELPSLNVY
jgi:hypothetical protein